MTADAAALYRVLAETAGECSGDPAAFVKVAFPWGTPALPHAGPDAWQLQVLEDVRDGLLTLDKAVQIAITSGHGVGKSALIAWLILWAMVTCEDTRGVVTANTEAQLRQKTWAELAKWHRLCLWREWFILSATALHAADPAHQQTWRIDAVAWSERSVEAFAGLHNEGKRILVVFDEGSAIPDAIWETTEGALTDTGTQIVWLVAGNPTRNTGRFRECFGRLKHRWRCHQVDSRTARIANKAQMLAWVADYGEDSDFVRVRVRGVFPRAGAMQFIGSDLVDAAAAADREVPPLLSDALVMGVDVARFGDDQTVLFFRKGRDGRAFPPIKLRGADTMQVASRVAAEAEALRVDAVFVDGGGVGAGVIDRCRQLRVQNVIEVQFGGKPTRPIIEEAGMRVRNKRAEMWASMRAWLEHGSIPNDPELIADLTGPEYSFDADNALVLESKPDMKRRGLASPDMGDALALTFAEVVQPHWRSGGLGFPQRPERRVFDPHAER